MDRLYAPYRYEARQNSYYTFHYKDGWIKNDMVLPSSGYHSHPGHFVLHENFEYPKCML